MKTIWKFSLKDGGLLKMPRGAEVLSVGMQNDEIMLWASVNAEAPRETRIFSIEGTGWCRREDIRSKFIGTVMTADHRFVWHVFEVTS